MAYKRKTVDEWEIHAIIDGKWEYICNEDTRAEAKRCKRDYENNGYPNVKIIKKRVKINE